MEKIKAMPKETTLLQPDYIFEVSWEVCNKVGGIYTVLSTRAKTMQQLFKDKVFFIGPELVNSENQHDFIPDAKLQKQWEVEMKELPITYKIGRWNVPGKPIAILLNYEQLRPEVNAIYTKMWDMAQVNSLQGYDDYEDATLFSYAAGYFVEQLVKHKLKATDKVIYQAHEWMASVGMLYLKRTTPQVGTIFTTHATSVGRSITSNNKLLYKYFSYYNGDQMAEELNVQAKHSNEKQAAFFADAFTTVSEFTAKECEQLFGKAVDVVLENGFENDFVPQKEKFTTQRKKARKAILQVANALLGEPFDDKTFIISISGRNDYRCKGFDVFFEALKRINQQELKRKVLALVEVPCWVKEAREDLQERLNKKEVYTTPLSDPFITHSLHNFYEDRILQTMSAQGLLNYQESEVKVLFVPCYLDGKDGIFNQTYYDLLIGNDLCIYPSYYEPWGYTPLESIAFKIPCITTDLSGFGQWVNQILGREAQIEDGVQVIPRNDGNYDQVAQSIADTIVNYQNLLPAKVTAIRRKAEALAEKALWKHFIHKYLDAYNFVLQQVSKRI